MTKKEIPMCDLDDELIDDLMLHGENLDPLKHGSCEFNMMCSDYGNCENCNENENARYKEMESENHNTTP